MIKRSSVRHVYYNTTFDAQVHTITLIISVHCYTAYSQPLINYDFFQFHGGHRTFRKIITASVWYQAQAHSAELKKIILTYFLGLGYDVQHFSHNCQVRVFGRSSGYLRRYLGIAAAVIVVARRENLEWHRPNLGAKFG